MLDRIKASSDPAKSKSRKNTEAAIVHRVIQQDQDAKVVIELSPTQSPKDSSALTPTPASPPSNSSALGSVMPATFVSNPSFASLHEEMVVYEDFSEEHVFVFSGFLNADS